MALLDFSNWSARVKARLAEVEHHYDLKVGEMLTVSNTSIEDLQELHSYGWSAAEATACIIENSGLR